MTVPEAAWYATHATPEELCLAFGPRWAICPATAKNEVRWGNCITRKQYEAAEAKALAARKNEA